MKASAFFLLIITLLLFSAIALGQTSPEIPRRPTPNVSTKPPMDWFDPSDSLQTAKIRRQVNIEESVKVSKNLKEKYKTFLQTPNSGIAKLFPIEAATLVEATKPINKPIARETSFYSFYNRLHQREFADLRLTGGQFVTGWAVDSFGAFEPMGETALDEITADSPKAISLLKPRLPKKKKLITDMMNLSLTNVEAALGKSILLRSAHSGYHDQLIALQVVETEVDGGLVIIWKRLFKGDAPNFKK